MNLAWYSLLPETPLGPLWLAVSPAGLIAISLLDDRDAFLADLARRGYDPSPDDSGKTAAASQELAEYLRGERSEFDLPIDWSGMGPFQVQALQAMYAIPYGQTRTYSQLASQIGHPGAARAVGRAGATNPIPLVVPCHRVVGADGSLRGYGGAHGIQDKRWLLEMEKTNS
jgi:methylated-DNA-[protein]-cysteine S-methyltransferase